MLDLKSDADANWPGVLFMFQTRQNHEAWGKERPRSWRIWLSGHPTSSDLTARSAAVSAIQGDTTGESSEEWLRPPCHPSNLEVSLQPGFSLFGRSDGMHRRLGN